MRLLLLLTALAALLLAAPPPAQCKPKTVKLRKHATRRAYRRAWDGSYAQWSKGEPAARRGRVAGHTLLFFDVDGDGTFGEVGVDAWAMDKKNYSYALPYETDIALGGRRVSINMVSDGSALTYLDHGSKPKGAIAEAAAHLNHLRATNGLPPVWVSPQLSAACTKHSRYMELNGIGHIKQPGKPGYTADGARAGKSGEVAMAAPRTAIDRFWRGVYHRTGPCDPEAREVGIGFHGRYTTFWAKRRRGAWVYPYLIPAPGVEDAQRAFDTWERPIPTYGDQDPGMPIQVIWPRGVRPGSSASGELRSSTSKGKLIEAYLSSAEAPSHPSQPLNRFSICLLPKAVLEKGQRYWVRVAWTWKGKPEERTWSFRCAK